MSDAYLVEQLIPPSVRGILEGKDPALSEDLYPITFAQDLQNVRVSGGKWETRKGCAAVYNFLLPGSGETRLFALFYEVDGSRFRLIGRGADNGGKLYDLEDGVDSAWQSVSGGTGLGTTTSNIPYWHFAQVGEAGYLTDRTNALKKYTPTAGLAAVTIPTAPSTAPGVKAWTYGVLDAFTGGGTLGWTESASGSFDISDGTSAATPPLALGVAKFQLTGGSTLGQTITKDVAGEDLNSRQIGFYFLTGDSVRKNVSFGFGLQKADEFAYPIGAPKKNEWYAIFIDVGALPEINFKRFKVIRGLNDEIFYLSALLLPGRLQGAYRWRYTNYNPTTGHESGLSPISLGGEAMDFSAIGATISEAAAVGAAFKKSCMLTFTSDSGTDAATTKIRIYRSGGVPELTIDSVTGRSIWLRVGEVNDLSNKLNGGHSVADTTLDVDSATGFAAEDWIVIAKGTSTEEYQKIVSIASNTLTVTPGLINNQSDDATVQIAFLDNVGNEAIDVLSTVEEERDTAPAAAHWVAKAPDGRIWLFRYTGAPTGIAVSNRPTPLRPNDHECFAEDVDPFTRADPSQGWTFGLGAEATGEEIVWGGFYRGLAHVLTRNKMFRVHALAQTDWGANAVQKVLDRGCISGHSVCQDGGYLYWVSEGPEVVRWDGQGPVEVLSDQRVNVRLKEADAAGTNDPTFWFGVMHENVHGRYYSLYFNYSNTENGCIQRLDYNINQDEWEPYQAFESNGLTKAWNAAVVYSGGTDSNQLVSVSYRGAVLENETGNTDAGVPIPYRVKTKRVPLGFVGQVHEVYVRLEAVTDEFSLTVTAGGSDYGTTTGTYTVDTSGSGDQDIWVPVSREIKGRWVELTLSGDVSNRPAVRELIVWCKPIRERQAANV